MKNPKNNNRKTKDLELALNDLDIQFWVDNDKNYYLWHEDFKCTTKEAWEIVDKQIGIKKLRGKKKRRYEVKADFESTAFDYLVESCKTAIRLLIANLGPDHLIDVAVNDNKITVSDSGEICGEIVVNTTNQDGVANIEIRFLSQIPQIPQTSQSEKEDHHYEE